MTDQDKKTIIEIIYDKIIEIEEELKLLEQAAQPIAPDSAYGRISRVDAINNKAIVDATLKDKRTAMHRLKYTLSRVNTEEFGRCKKCGQDIVVKRLMSIPYTDLCMTCAVKYG